MKLMVQILQKERRNLNNQEDKKLSLEASKDYFREHPVLTVVR